MFVVAEISFKFPYRAGCCPNYAGIMLYAFQPLLCLKLYQHNQRNPSGGTVVLLAELTVVHNRASEM